MFLGFIIAGAVVGYLAIGCVTARVAHAVADRLMPPDEPVMPPNVRAAMSALFWPVLWVFALMIPLMGALYLLGRLAGEK